MKDHVVRPSNKKRHEICTASRFEFGPGGRKQDISIYTEATFRNKPDVQTLGGRK